jgi:hypothetical protein
MEGQAMKRTLLLAAALLLGAGPSAAMSINDPPKIALGTGAKIAFSRMKGAGWLPHNGRCLNAYPDVCEADFVNQCGVVFRATFLNERMTSMRPVAFIENPPTGTPKYPPCIDGTD